MDIVDRDRGAVRAQGRDGNVCRAFSGDELYLCGDRIDVSSIAAWLAEDGVRLGLVTWCLGMCVRKVMSHRG